MTKFYILQLFACIIIFNGCGGKNTDSNVEAPGGDKLQKQKYWKQAQMFYKIKAP